MKVIYKLPQFLALAVFIGMIIQTYPYIPLSNATNVLELAKYQQMVDSTLVNATGVDLYTIMNNIVIAFILVLAVIRRNVIDVKAWVAVIIAVLYNLHLILGVWLLHAIEDVLTKIDLSVITMTGQYIYGTLPLTIILAFILAKVLKMSTWRMLDYIAPLWLIKIVFTRLACFSAGCCGVEQCTLRGIDLVLPAQLFEVFLALILLQIVFNIERKSIGENRECSKEGVAFVIAFAGPLLFRFLVDFMRDIPVAVLGMASAQIYSLICIAILIAILIRKISRQDTA